MKWFFDAIDGNKTYNALGLLAAATMVLPVLGVPVAITAGIGAVGTILGVVGRWHAGEKISISQQQAVELRNQVEALKQYVKDGQRG
jgi:hypothetical protein